MGPWRTGQANPSSTGTNRCHTRCALFVCPYQPIVLVCATLLMCVCEKSPCLGADSTQCGAVGCCPHCRSAQARLLKGTQRFCQLGRTLMKRQAGAVRVPCDISTPACHPEPWMLIKCPGRCKTPLRGHNWRRFRVTGFNPGVWTPLAPFAQHVPRPLACGELCSQRQQVRCRAQPERRRVHSGP